MTGFLKANYHTHTYRCQHAYGSEREYIEAAIRMGIAELGFSDHVPCPFKDGYVSGIRMTMEQAPEYVYAKVVHSPCESIKNEREGISKCRRILGAQPDSSTECM